MNRRAYAILAIGIATAVVMGPRAAAPQTGARDTAVARKAFVISGQVRIADRRSKCMRAIGSQEFCDCLSTLPLNVDFERYIRIATNELGALSDEDRALADPVLATRDRCVTAFTKAK